MTSEYEPEFTHKQGLMVALAGFPLFFGFIYFGQEHRGELALGAFIAVVATLVIRRDLIRRRWFLIFVAVMALAHLGLILVNPWSDFSRGEFKVFVVADLLIVLGLAFGLEKVASLWNRRTI